MKTAAFIPVRLSSTRLPSKALLPILGKSCFQILIERIKKIKELDGIILCTTTNPKDDKLVELGKKLDIEIFRGSEMDVLERFRGAANEFQVENIVNIDGDDILCEPEFIKKTIFELENNQWDYIFWKDLPLGTTPIGIKRGAIEAVCSQKDNKNTETGWGKFFTETGLFKIKILTSDDPVLRNKDIRLTLDYPEDLKLFEQIFEHLNQPFNIKDIVNFLNERRDIKDLNKGIRDEYWKNFEKKSTKIKMRNE